MYKLVVFVDQDNSQKVKTAMFAAGGGQIGNYDCCCFEVIGTGQFRALEGSQPYIGRQGEIEKVVEVRIEMVCANKKIKEVVAAMIAAHPYETPAYDIMKLEEVEGLGW